MQGPTRSETYDAIHEYLCGLTIIDAHEHLKPERHHLEQPLDFAWLFQYLAGDLYSAGLKGFDGTDSRMTAAEKWRLVEPFWPQVKHGSYGRGVRLTVQALIGQDDLNAGNFEAVGEALRAANTPGLYMRVLRDTFRIERAVVSNGTRAIEPYPYDGRDYEMLSLIIGIVSPRSGSEVEYYETATGTAIRKVEDLIQAVTKMMRDAAAEEHVVGFKAAACPMGAPDQPVAEAALRCLREKKPVAPAGMAALNRAFYDAALSLAGELGLPVAVHCGVWGDFRTLDVMNFWQTMARMPQVRFDLFHMSMPSVRQAAMAGKNLPNAHLNLCWSPLVSQRMFEAGLAEWLDLVPTGKITGFGGDFIWCPQLLHGHLAMCRESLSRVFADRVDRGWMGIDDAKAILTGWMYDNPKRLYRL
ncbi:MAG: amidohydrolase family protein [Phycisphaerae bacterium]